MSAFSIPILQRIYTKGSSEPFVLTTGYLRGFAPVITGAIVLRKDDREHSVKCSIKATTTNTGLTVACIEVIEEESGISVKVGNLPVYGTAYSNKEDPLQIDIQVTLPSECSAVKIESQLLKVDWLSGGSIEGDVELITKSHPILVDDIRCTGTISCETQSGALSFKEDAELRSSRIVIINRSGRIEAPKVVLHSDWLDIQNGSGTTSIVSAVSANDLSISTRSASMTVEMKGREHTVSSWTLESQASSNDLELSKIELSEMRACGCCGHREVIAPVRSEAEDCDED